MGINFAAANTAGLNNPGTEIITLVKDGSGNFINPPSYDKMRAYLRGGEVPMLFVTAEGGETGSLYQLDEYSETENKIRFSNSANAIEFAQGAVAPVVSDVVPKPLTYDYMPEGYPKKSGFDIEWDGNTDGLTSAIYNSNISFYKVSDIVPTNDELSGGTFTVSDVGEVIHITSDMITTPSEDLRMVSEYIVIVQKENATVGNALFPQTGTYFYKGTNTGTYIARLSKQTVTPMSEEFLPSEVNELIMNSSTTGSTKKFKITVDDGGTISATEVT